MQFNAEEAQPLTDARADEWRVFTDASHEDDCLQSTERSGAGADPLFHLIKPLLQCFANLVQRELDARLAAVDRQDTGLIEFLRHRV
jgi:hypothetical protein